MARRTSWTNTSHTRRSGARSARRFGSFFPRDHVGSALPPPSRNTSEAAYGFHSTTTVVDHLKLVMRAWSAIMSLWPSKLVHAPSRRCFARLCRRSKSQPSNPCLRTDQRLFECRHMWTSPRTPHRRRWVPGRNCASPEARLNSPTSWVFILVEARLWSAALQHRRNV